MSVVESHQDLTERFLEFFRTYYRDEIGVLAQHYPNEHRSLYIEYDDLYTHDRDIAEDYLEKPDEMRAFAEEALSLFDLPVDIDLSGANVRLTDTRDAMESISLAELEAEHIGDFVAITGQIEKVTKVDPNLETAHWVCQRCTTPTPVDQGRNEVQQPHECVGCERQGPFDLHVGKSDWVDQRKLKLGELPRSERPPAGSTARSTSRATCVTSAARTVLRIAPANRPQCSRR